MNLPTLSNEELIDFVYSEIAAPKILQAGIDFSDANKWRVVVNALPKPVATVYRLAILHMQVLNGGFIQYFDNGYGIFAYETLSDLEVIKANQTYKLLKKSLELINPKNLTGESFLKLIYEKEYEPNYESLGPQLNQIDEEYYGLEEIEILEDLLGDYLKEHLDELQQTIA